MDYRKFRIYLEEKYGVSRAYIFIGFMEEHADLYKSLQQMGYILIFKPVLKYKNGEVKGNCDAELVLQAMIDLNEYEKAIIVAGDGDYYCLIKHLINNKKLKKLLVPNQGKYSALLKRIPSEFLAFVSDLKGNVEYIDKKS